MKTKAKRRATALSKAEIARLDRRLRYMNPENIAKDFPVSKSLSVLSAVFEWLSLNGIAARSQKGGRYATNMAIRNKKEAWRYDALVLDRAALERAEVALGIKRRETS